MFIVEFLDSTVLFILHLKLGPMFSHKGTKENFMKTQSVPNQYWIC